MRGEELGWSEEKRKEKRGRKVFVSTGGVRKM